jgi:MFS family permease
MNAAPSPTVRQSMRLVTVAWLFGSTWWNLCLLGVPITLYAKTLGATDFHIGLLTALPFLALLVSIPASILIDSSGERKKIFMIGLLVQRFMWFPIVVIPTWLIWGNSHEATKHLALWVFIAMMLVMYASQAVGGPAWLSWMADLVPKRIRGRYFARRRQLGIIPAIPALLLVGYAINQFAGPDSSEHAKLVTIGIIFLIGAVCGIIDIILFKWVPHTKPSKAPKGQLLRSILEPLQDKRFLGFSLAVAITGFTAAPLGMFLTLYLNKHLGVDASTTQIMLLVLPLVVQMIFWPVWGQMVDLMGMRPTILIASLGQIPLFLAWIMVGQGQLWMGYVLGAGMMVLASGIDAVNLQTILGSSGAKQMTDDGEKLADASTNFPAANSLVVGAAGFLGGILGGVLMEKTQHLSFDPGMVRPIGHYEVLFVVVCILRLVLTLAILPMLQEPDAKSTVQATRFLVVRMAQTLLHPLHWIRSRLEPRDSEI